MPQGDKAVTFSDSNGSLIVFEAFTEEEGLPFPLYLNFGWRILISLVLLAILIVGLHYRIIILKYIWTKESNKPINFLILMDQLNSLMLGFGLVVRIVSMLSPAPLSQAFGSGD